MGPDVNNLPDFGSIKIRTDPGHKLVWQYLFTVESSSVSSKYLLENLILSASSTTVAYGALQMNILLAKYLTKLAQISHVLLELLIAIMRIFITFCAILQTRDVIGRLVQEEMALGDLDGSDEVEFDQDSRDYGATTKGRERFSRRRLSSRKKSDQSESDIDTEHEGDTYTDNYQTSGGSKFSYVFALLYLAHILLM